MQTSTLTPLVAVSVVLLLAGCEQIARDLADRLESGNVAPADEPEASSKGSDDMASSGEFYEEGEPSEPEPQTSPSAGQSLFFLQRRTLHFFPPEHSPLVVQVRFSPWQYF